MKSNLRETSVAGKIYKVWSDFIARGTFAEDENGVVKQISFSGYISSDLTVRKAIACMYGLSTFRK